MAKASDNPFPSILLVEQGSAPETPGSGQARFYRGDDGGLYVVDGTGAVTAVGGGAGGGGLKDRDQAVVTSGDITLNQTAITGISSTDITLTAAAGDVIEYGLSARLGNEAQYVALDVYTMVGGSRVNPFHEGLSASLGGTSGVQAWFSNNTAGERYIGGSAERTLVSGDISSGAVTLRLHYVKLNTTARTLYASTSVPLRVWAKNLGPVSA